MHYLLKIPQGTRQMFFCLHGASVLKGKRNAEERTVSQFYKDKCREFGAMCSRRLLWALSN